MLHSPFWPGPHPRSAALPCLSSDRLGNSTQVPAKSSYNPRGTRGEKAAGRAIALQRSRAPILDNGLDNANAVRPVLARIGNPGVDEAKGCIRTRFAEVIVDCPFGMLPRQLARDSWQCFHEAACGLNPAQRPATT